jgi:hypothetical protein
MRHDELNVGSLVWKVPKKRCVMLHGNKIMLDTHVSGTLGVVIEKNVQQSFVTVYHGSGIISSGFFEDYHLA